MCAEASGGPEVGRKGGLFLVTGALVHGALHHDGDTHGPSFLRYYVTNPFEIFRVCWGKQ